MEKTRGTKVSEKFSLSDFIKKEFTDKGYTHEETLAIIRNWNSGWPKPEVDCYKPGTRCNLRQWDSSLIQEGAYYDCPKCGKHYRFIMSSHPGGRGSRWELKEMGKLENAWFRFKTSEFAEPEWTFVYVFALLVLMLMIVGVVQSF